MAKPESFIHVVDICDNFRPTKATEPLIPWKIGSAVIGLLRPCIVGQLKIENEQRSMNNEEPDWEITIDAISFAKHLKSPSQRSTAMRRMCCSWRDSGLWPDVIGPRKWRDELYPVYYDPFGQHILVKEGTRALEAGTSDEDESAGTCPNYAFSMERTTCALFGVVTYGVHMSMYQEDVNGEISMWVPTRAKTKQTWPGMLDNTVAGGIPTGLGTLECIAKECMEEATLSEDIVRKHIRPVGSISYYFRTTAGWLQPEVQYVYDLRIPSHLDDHKKDAFRPRPLDGEVESFEMLPLDTIKARMHEHKFKSNCALVIIDFLIRHGLSTPENEPHYLEINTRLHGQFEYTSWGCLGRNDPSVQ